MSAPTILDVLEKVRSMGVTGHIFASLERVDCDLPGARPLYVLPNGDAIQPADVQSVRLFDSNLGPRVVVNCAGAYYVIDAANNYAAGQLRDRIIREINDDRKRS